MAQIDYSFLVELTLDSGSTYTTVSPAFAASTRRLLDGADGNDNGFVADGDSITLLLGPFSVDAVLLGLDANGVAVQQNGSGTIYYLSNAPIGAQVTLADGTLDFSTAPTVATERSFGNLHVVQENTPGNYEIVTDGSSATLSPPPRVIDDQDSTADGVVADGAFVTAEAGPLVPNSAYAVVDITGSGEIIVNSGGTLYMFSDQSYTAEDLFTANSASTVLCFAAGTSIAVPGGEVAVEALRIGDLVRTAEGRDVPVRWIGRQTILKRFFVEKSQLVRIKAGALGNHSDLYVTADHGMVLEGFVIEASALVNGGGIDFVPLAETPERFTVYHIETEAHDVILANGAASETYLDLPGRRAFDNYQEYVDLYGAEEPIRENKMPRIAAPRLVPRDLRTRIAV